MNKDKFKNLTVIDGVKSETEQIKETSQNTYQSNPLKTDLYYYTYLISQLFHLSLLA